MAAQPDIEKKVENMVKNHRWMPPGYKVWTAKLIRVYTGANNHYRRSLVTLPSFRCGGRSHYLVLYLLEAVEEYQAFSLAWVSVSMDADRVESLRES
jgi:hypothetical protein